MQIYNITTARKNLFSLIDEASTTHEPIYITGKRSEAVIVSKEDYDALQETLYLYSLPNLVNIITEARKETLEDCATELDW